MQTDRRRWSLIDDATAPRWRCWGGDFVVFNGFSGNTHRLELLAGEIFFFVKTGPKSFSEICTFASDFLEIPDGSNLASTIEGILTSLEEVGLLESEP